MVPRLPLKRLSGNMPSYDPSVSDEPKQCVRCQQRPTGPGGIICPECRAEIEENNRRDWPGEG